ncbi:hypothetical protein PUHLTONIO_67 [Mycobacterium phage Puhltonio]|uniref:Uncharacterized protein n=1 Tax=Mycobacterium phage Puhltonio TaxID=663558 RepID=C9DCD6_9CAUD|nr:hypothetical protein PUHLTONIO_67 [Mycobacterium phage Puhltonio]
MTELNGMTDDELRARLGLTPVDRPQTMEERIRGPRGARDARARGLRRVRRQRVR